MATTVKELGEKLEDIYERVTSKFEAGSKELSIKLENSSKELATKLETNSKELTGKIDSTVEDLSETKSELAAVLATLNAVKWIGTAAVVVTAILGSAGIFKILDDQKKLQESTAKLQESTALNTALSSERARLLKAELIDKIDRDLTSAGSLDMIKQLPRAWYSQFQRRAQSLEKNNANLGISEKTQYFLIVKALSAYHDNKLDECLRLLDEIHGEDEEHFGYMSLRGACLARDQRFDEADNWFNRASDFANDRAQMLDVQRGYSALSKWTISKKPDDLQRAITIYEGMTVDYPRFLAGYFNLAGAYSLAKDLPKVTSTLKKAHFVKTVVIADYIVKDMLVEKDFENYVRGQLNVAAKASDGSFKSDLSSALELELKK